MNQEGFKNLSFHPDSPGASTSTKTHFSETNFDNESNQSNKNNNLGSHDLTNYKQGSQSTNSLKNYNNNNLNNKDQRISSKDEINLTSSVNQDSANEIVYFDGKRSLIKNQSLANLSEILSESSSKEIELSPYKNKQHKSFDISGQGKLVEILCQFS